MILYLRSIISIYIIIRTLHGVYVSYLFLYTMLNIIHQPMFWIYSYFNKEIEINEKEVENDYILINI